MINPYCLPQKLLHAVPDDHQPEPRGDQDHGPRRQAVQVARGVPRVGAAVHPTGREQIQ